MRPILHNIAKNINVLNVLLLTVLVFTSIYVLTSFLKTDLKEILPSPAKIEAGAATASPMAKTAPQIDYNMIVSQNLFHPERKAPALDKDAAGDGLKPDLILYGTLIADNMSIAFIEDKKSPYYTPGRGKRQTQLKKGDKIYQYVLKEIEPDHIVLVKGEDRLVFMLDDGEKRGGDQLSRPPSPPMTRSPSPNPLAPSPSGAGTNQPVTRVQDATDAGIKARGGPTNADAQSKREQFLQMQRDRIRMLQELNKKTP